MQRPTDTTLAWGLAIAVPLLAVLHAVGVFPHFVEDDAYISFRYADRLTSGHGLTWTEGTPVEGYSDLLWVLLVALLERLGLDHIDGARLLGLLGITAAVGATGLDPVTFRPAPRRALTGGLALMVTGAIAAWAMGGLEHTFQAGLVAIAMLAVIRCASDAAPRSVWVAGSLGLGLVALTRVDGVVLVAGALLGAVVATGRLWPFVAMGLPTAAFLSGQMAFRLATYGEWVPHTGKVKISGTWVRTWHGLQWVATGLARHGVLVATGLLALRGAGRSPRVWVPLCTAVLWCTYVALVGGDIFAAWRQLVPCLPAWAFLAAEAAAPLAAWPRTRAAALVGVLLAVHLGVSNTGRTWKLAREDRYEWDVEPVADAMVTAWGDRDPLIAVDAAGALPYFTRFRSLDMLGLNDAYLVDHPPKVYGGRGIGHDLGDPEYVLDAKPDVMAFNSGLGTTRPRFPVGRALSRRPAYRQAYPYVRIAATSRGKTVVAWYRVRREAGPLAVVRSADHIEVPGWFFASPDSHPARLRGGTLATPVTEARPGTVLGLPVPAGTWRVTVEPEPLVVRVPCGDQRVAVDVVELDRPTRLDWSVGGTGHVAAMTLTRTTDPGVAPCPPTSPDEAGRPPDSSQTE